MRGVELGCQKKPGESLALPPTIASVRTRSWWQRYRFLLLRRTVQFSILLFFAIGPVGGFWILKGSLASSQVLELVPMTDWFVFLQMLASRHWPELTAWMGVAVVLVLYLVVGGRSYCAWVCPLNVLTDTAAWLRRRMGLKGGKTPDASLRLWLLAASLVAALLTGNMVWEWVNPVSWTHRAVIFGVGAAWWLVLAVFLYDVVIAPRGWCGHLCPQGAAYSLLGSGALVRVSAARREQCDDCMDCFAVCPEPKVIRPALKGAPGSPRVIFDPQCTNCGRCIDVCDRNVFQFTYRFDRREP